MAIINDGFDDDIVLIAARNPKFSSLDITQSKCFKK